MGGILNKQDYVVLQVADVAAGGEIAKILNRNGCANWTVCPWCRVDDFSHIENCEGRNISREKGLAWTGVTWFCDEDGKYKMIINGCTYISSDQIAWAKE